MLNRSVIIRLNAVVIHRFHVVLKKRFTKGGRLKMTEEEKELNEMLDRIEKQHETLRKENGEGEPYKHLKKQKHVTVYTNDKKAMKFWEE